MEGRNGKGSVITEASDGPMGFTVPSPHWCMCESAEEEEKREKERKWQRWEMVFVSQHSLWKEVSIATGRQPPPGALIRL